VPRVTCAAVFIYYTANSYSLQQSARGCQQCQGQQGGSLPAQPRSQLGFKAQAWASFQGVYLCLLHQSESWSQVSIAWSLSGCLCCIVHSLCLQSEVAMFSTPFELFVCGDCHAPLPGKCVLQRLWLCITFLWVLCIKHPIVH